MLKILVVDDRPVNRENLVSLLGNDERQILEAEDGSEALEVVRRERPDLVLTDIVMPKTDGYELARQIRLDEAIADTRVIFCTAAYQEAEARRFAKACGVLHLLTKPLVPEEVLKAVESALQYSPHVPLPLSEEQFDRTHRRLLMDKLARKVVELEAEIEVRKGAEHELQEAQMDLERRVNERTAELCAANEKLQTALIEIKTLSGLLPICSCCNSIRDDEGKWQRLETYIMERSYADFSHSVCPNCIPKLYPQYAAKINAEKC